MHIVFAVEGSDIAGWSLHCCWTKRRKSVG